MKKVFIFILVFFNCVFANTKIIEAKYNISYGIFSNLGVATATLRIISNKKYYIKMEAKATGLAKFLSSSRVETYESFGEIRKGVLIPNKFIKTKKSKYKNRVREYFFEDNQILVKDKRNDKKRVFNSEFVQEIKPIKSYKQYTLDYYAKNDILSLFFNLKSFVKEFKKDTNFKFYAVGANKTKGLININIPNKKEYKSLQENLDTKDKIKFIAQINQKIFDSKKGELLISINDYGFCTKAVLKDVLIFGDIKGEMIDIKIKEINAN